MKFNVSLHVYHYSAPALFSATLIFLMQFVIYNIASSLLYYECDKVRFDMSIGNVRNKMLLFALLR